MEMAAGPYLGVQNDPLQKSITKRAYRRVIFFFILLLYFVYLGWVTPAGAGWTGVGPQGGEVLALAIDPVNPQTVYAGTGGGVYKSTNGGKDWQLLNQSMQLTTISALAIDPGTPQTVYAASSEGGVYKSTDGGGIWSEADSGITTRHMTSLAIDPKTRRRSLPEPGDTCTKARTAVEPGSRPTQAWQSTLSSSVLRSTP